MEGTPEKHVAAEKVFVPERLLRHECGTHPLYRPFANSSDFYTSIWVKVDILMDSLLISPAVAASPSIL